MMDHTTADMLYEQWEAAPAPLEELPKGLIGDEI